MGQLSSPSRMRTLARDYLYVLPGMPLALASVVLLVPLTALSLGTFVIWVGALLMPLTLLLATGLADLSRLRLRAWGQEISPAHYKPTTKSFAGFLRVMTDPRRWLDLVFETLVALPLRLTSFVVALTWTALAVGGLTSWFWKLFLPGEPHAESGWPLLVREIAPRMVPQSDVGMYLLDSAINLVLGALALLSLPWVIHGLARFDALIARALLSGSTSKQAPDHLGRIPHAALILTVSPAGWAWVGTGFAAVVLLAISWPVLATIHGVHPALAMVLAISQGAALVLTVRRPTAATAMAILAAAGTMLASASSIGHGTWPWPVTSLISYCLVILALALRHHWLWAAAVWSASTALTAGAFVLIAGAIPHGGLANGIVVVSVGAAVGLLAVLGRMWVKNLGRAEQAERVSAEELQRRRDLEERNRIARELHDVVAHSMSVINVQATTAQYRKPGIDPEIQQEFDDIAQSSRQALSEMRSLLALLRNDEAPTAPMPTMTDVPDLIEATRASGAEISYSGTDDEVSPTVGLTAFRVIQEALSNALRHAPGAAVTVTARSEAEVLIITVANSKPLSVVEAAPGSGLGLAGIRERVTALGGTVQAGPRLGGGFRLRVQIPMDHAHHAGDPLPE
ncbi:sensor histidine kinase [Bogoriella caseilytica]|nr:sensor histidine kinase [Bogoriella caseilytica]